MLKKNLQLFVEGNINPRGDGSFAGCKELINFSETIYKAKRIILTDVYIFGSAYPPSGVSHLVLDVCHPSLHDPILSNKPNLLDRHIILPDQISGIKGAAAGILDICHPAYNRVLFTLDPGSTLSNLSVLLSSPEGARIDRAILKFEIWHESSNYRSVTSDKLNPSSHFNSDMY